MGEEGIIRRYAREKDGTRQTAWHKLREVEVGLFSRLRLWEVFGKIVNSRLVEFKREMTMGEGDDRCDFRYLQR